MRRSSSVSKVNDEEISKRYPKTFQPVLEKKTGRLYRQRSSFIGNKFLFLPLVDNPKLLHAHKEKSFENQKSSPSSRLRMIKESSIFSSHKKKNTSRLFRSSTDKSLHRKEKSTEILTHASKIVVTEKENNEEIKKVIKDFHKIIREQLKGINEKLIHNGIPSIQLTKKIFDKRKRTQKILINRNV
jgi:hypothetical protein